MQIMQRLAVVVCLSVGCDMVKHAMSLLPVLLFGMQHFAIVRCADFVWFQRIESVFNVCTVTRLASLRTKM